MACPGDEEGTEGVGHEVRLAHEPGEGNSPAMVATENVRGQGGAVGTISSVESIREPATAVGFGAEDGAAVATITSASAARTLAARSRIATGAGADATTARGARATWTLATSPGVATGTRPGAGCAPRTSGGRATRSTARPWPSTQGIRHRGHRGQGICKTHGWDTKGAHGGAYPGRRHSLAHNTYTESVGDRPRNRRLSHARDTKAHTHAWDSRGHTGGHIANVADACSLTWGSGGWPGTGASHATRPTHGRPPSHRILHSCQCCRHAPWRHTAHAFQLEPLLKDLLQRAGRLAREQISPWMGEPQRPEPRPALARVGGQPGDAWKTGQKGLDRIALDAGDVGLTAGGGKALGAGAAAEGEGAEERTQDALPFK